MRQLKNGNRLCLILAFLFSACRTSRPPDTSVCIGDGFGGANCQLIDGSPLAACCSKVMNQDGSLKGYYCLPSCLKNAWMTSETEEAHFVSWCYDTDLTIIKNQMKNIKQGLH